MTAKAAPVWLLDFDGVVNAISSKGGKSVWPIWETARVPHPSYPTKTLPLLWSPAVVDTIRHAVDAGVDVRWLTTWREHTKTLPEVIHGLPDIPWLDESVLSDEVASTLDPDQRMASGMWKFEVARAYVPDDAPLLWTDDSYWIMSWSKEVPAWVSKRGAPTELIQPTETLGLVQRQVRAIREWIDLRGV